MVLIKKMVFKRICIYEQTLQNSAVQNSSRLTVEEFWVGSGDRRGDSGNRRGRENGVD